MVNSVSVKKCGESHTPGYIAQYYFMPATVIIWERNRFLIYKHRLLMNKAREAEII